MGGRITTFHPQKWPLARMGRRSGGWVFAERAFFSANEVKTRSRRARCVRPLEAVRMENLLLRFIPPKAALGSSRSHGHGRPWLFRPYRLQRVSDNDGMPGRAGHDGRRRRWRDARSSRMRRLKTVCPARGDAENLIVWPRAGRFIYAILFASRKQRIQPKSGRDRHQAAHPSFSRPPPRRSTTDESRSPRRNTATRCLVMLGMRPEGVILSRKHAADDPRRECDGDKERPDYYAFFCAATDAADGQRLM